MKATVLMFALWKVEAFLPISLYGHQHVAVVLPERFGRGVITKLARIDLEDYPAKTKKMAKIAYASKKEVKRCKDALTKQRASLDAVKKELTSLQDRRLELEYELEDCKDDLKETMLDFEKSVDFFVFGVFGMVRAVYCVMRAKRDIWRVEGDIIDVRLDILKVDLSVWRAQESEQSVKDDLQKARRNLSVFSYWYEQADEGEPTVAKPVALSRKDFVNIYARSSCVFEVGNSTSISGFDQVVTGKRYVATRKRTKTRASVGA